MVELICGMVADAPFAVRVLTVDAVNQPRVVSFYERLGFLQSMADQRERKNQLAPATVLMLKDLYL